MKTIVWAYPVTAVTIQVYENLEQEEPLYQENVWFDEIILTLRKLPDINQIDEIIVMGPSNYAGHVVEKIQDHFFDIQVTQVTLGE